MAAVDLAKLTADDLAFYNWHETPVWARTQLREWVWGMERARDGERGSGPDGAGAWLDEKIALSRPGGLFQTFVAVYRDDVVWTGSMVEDDRGVRRQFAGTGYRIDAFFGLFNTRCDLRGRGIGWAGANYVSEYISKRGEPSVALFTANPAAERNYTAIGFKLVGDIYIPAFAAVRRVYIRSENRASI